MNLIIEGWQVLQQYAIDVLLIAACAFWGAAVIVGRMGCAVDRLTLDEALGLAAGAWIVPAWFASIAVLLLGSVLRSQIILQASIGSIALATLTAVWLAQLRHRPSHQYFGLAGSGLVVAAAVLIFVRFAFIGGLTLPLYFDSAAHYGITRQLLDLFTAGLPHDRLALPVPGYYHLGYHILVAGWSRLFRIDIASLMLVSGQLVLAVLPLPLYLMIHRTTGSAAAGLVGVLLGALGWYMPSYAVNWGKYPAILAALAVLTSLNLALLSREAGPPEPRKWTMRALALLAAVIAVVIHTRALIIMGMIAGAWWLAGVWLNLPPRVQARAAAFAAIAATGVVAITWFQPALWQVMDPYLGAGRWMMLGVAALAPVAVRAHPRVSIACILSMFLLLTGMLIPVPVAEIGSLLDRPLVEMWLYMPLAVLGAVGVAGLMDSLPPVHSIYRYAAAMGLGLAILANALGNYSFHPSACCVIVGGDDMVALRWLGRDAPADSVVGIALAPLRLVDADKSLLEAPSDAGAWVQPLTGLRAREVPYQIDFADSMTWASLCATGTQFIYVGALPQSFDRHLLASRRDFYRPRLLLPSAAIYELAGCTS